jgi:transcriptional regulator
VSTFIRNVLTEASVAEIKRLLKDGRTQTELGRLYGVTQACISDIYRERRWRHVQC